MIKVEEYIKLTQEGRQKHFDLEEDCIEIGGDSRNFKGLLAYYLNTTIPGGSKIYLCHACHNGHCCNPTHLYWGTPSENYYDSVENGNDKSFYQKTIDKYGIDKVNEMRKISCRKGGLIGGPMSKGRKHSEETKQKIRESNLGKKRSQETRDKISANNRTRVVSKETREKLSELRKNK